MVSWTLEFEVCIMPQVLCLDGECCRTPGQTEGECTRHARACGGGQGLFIMPYASVVRNSRRREGSVMINSPAIVELGRIVLCRSLR